MSNLDEKVLNNASETDVITDDDASRKLPLKDKFLNFMKENSDRCFLEIQHHKVEDQIEYNKKLYEYSKKYNIRLITGTDTHALNESHVKGRKILQLSKDINFENDGDRKLRLSRS